MSDHKADFWKRLRGVQAVMIGIDGQDRMMPMSPQIDDDPSEIWIITAKGNPLVTAVETAARTARVVVGDAKQGLYADIDGHLTLSHDPAKLDEVWSAVASAWFDGGERDEDVRLLKFAPQTAEVWLTDTSALKFFYEIAKGNLTDAEPDAGEHATLTF